MTVLVYLLLAGVFGWLVYSRYKQINQELFLSLDSEEGICKEVPLEVSGTFLADNAGNWEGHQEFDYTRAIYSFSFNRLESSESEFVDVIDSVLSRVDAITAVMRANNLATTILFWTTWVFVSSAEVEGNSSSLGKQSSFLNDDKTHFFSLTGGCVCGV